MFIVIGNRFLSHPMQQSIIEEMFGFRKSGHIYVHDIVHSQLYILSDNKVGIHVYGIGYCSVHSIVPCCIF